jgi:hypothetical protein
LLKWLAADNRSSALVKTYVTSKFLFGKFFLKFFEDFFMCIFELEKKNEKSNS